MVGHPDTLDFTLSFLEISSLVPSGLTPQYFPPPSGPHGSFGPPVFHVLISSWVTFFRQTFFHRSFDGPKIFRTGLFVPSPLPLWNDNGFTVWCFSLQHSFGIRVVLLVPLCVRTGQPSSPFTSILFP